MNEAISSVFVTGIMDWFSWLSESNLDQPLVREYSLRLSSNELEEDDLAFFDNAFLQSMGISVAKHREEILDLAKKTCRRRRRSSRRLPLRSPALPLAAANLAAAVKRSKNRFTRYVGELGCSTSEPATWVLSPRRGARWRGAMLRTKTKVELLRKESRESGGGGGGYGHWYGAGGGTRWDAMFQNLKPT